MATGINVSGTTIQVEDNAHADADLDGVLDVYSFQDVALKAIPQFTDLVTFEKSYRAQYNIQNGDGVGTAATTIEDFNSDVLFDSTRSYLCSTVGETNRLLKLGRLVQGPQGKPSGTDGCRLSFGATATIRGRVKLYGSTLRVNLTTGTMNIVPSSGITEDSEIINCIFQAGRGFSIGLGAASAINRIYNLDILSGSVAPSVAITNWNAKSAERITVAADGHLRFFSTGSRIRVRDLVMIGTPTDVDIQLTGTLESDLVEPVYSDNAPQLGVILNYLNEWWRYLPNCQESGIPVQAVPIRLLDKDSVDVLGGVIYTDAQGGITYNTDPDALDIFDDVVKVRRAIGSAPAPWEDRGPFTVRANLDGTTIPTYFGVQRTFRFPRRTGVFGDLLSPMLDIIQMVRRGGGSREDWRPDLA